MTFPDCSHILTSKRKRKDLEQHYSKGTTPGLSTENEAKTMAEAPLTLTGRQLKTPRVAAVAGIIFAILMSTALVLIRLSIPTDLSDTGASLARQAGTVSLALSLAPFAGIAFLWFMGVLRDRLGHLEDQFFSTVFLGSGLLYLGLSLVSAALAQAFLASSALIPGLVRTSVYTFSRLAIYQINNIYALKMSGVFMISLGTIWLQTRMMPRWLVFVTYALALVVLLSISLNIWFTLTFPAWVFVISLYILVGNLRNPSTGADSSPETA